MIKLRPATIDDLELVEYWDTKQHVIDSDPDDDWEWEVELARTPPWREQLVAEKDDEPIGFIQIIDPFKEETGYWGEVGKNHRAIDIWIGEEKNLSRGYGTKMMQLALARCFSNPEVITVLIDPLKTNTRAHRFYERIGFEFVEERDFDDVTCFVYQITREKFDCAIV